MTSELTWDFGAKLQRRPYASYEEYLVHQRQKFDRMTPAELEAYEARYLTSLRPRLAASGLARGTTVLCLGARSGAEVLAFIELGCVAVGIDLNPGPVNPYVLLGDFHALPYGSGTLDVVFTNALDHCYALDRVLAEVFRVLKLGGQFLVEAVRGTREGCALGPYESFSWDTIDALITAIESRGFKCAYREPFESPWPGEHLVFKKWAGDLK